MSEAACVAIWDTQLTPRHKVDPATIDWIKANIPGTATARIELYDADLGHRR